VVERLEGGNAKKMELKKEWRNGKRSRGCKRNGTE